MAVRWNTTSCALLSFATSGTSCTELAASADDRDPLIGEIDASRQRAEWNHWPAKESRPGMSGSTGSLNMPSALTRTSTTISRSVSVCTRHTASSRPRRRW